MSVPGWAGYVGVALILLGAGLIILDEDDDE